MNINLNCWRYSEKLLNGLASNRFFIDSKMTTRKFNEEKKTMSKSRRQKNEFVCNFYAKPLNSYPFTLNESPFILLDTWTGIPFTMRSSPLLVLLLSLSFALPGTVRTLNFTENFGIDDDDFGLINCGIFG